MCAWKLEMMLPYWGVQIHGFSWSRLVHLPFNQMSFCSLWMVKKAYHTQKPLLIRVNAFPS